MFGLSQLYQLRGRIGRAKQRAYAYLTTPADKKLTETAARRLEVLQSLDQLGAGFSVASHDMDIRGAGNLLGEEQSGHVARSRHRAVPGDAGGGGVADARGRGPARWPINGRPDQSGRLGADSRSLCADLNVRMSLYRRLSGIETREDIDRFAAELIDRFGPLPDEVRHLFEIVAIKQLAAPRGVEKIDAGPKGGTIAFRDNVFANPIGAGETHQPRISGTMKVRPDQKIVVSRDWPTPEARLKGAQSGARPVGEAGESGVKTED